MGRFCKFTGSCGWFGTNGDSGYLRNGSALQLDIPTATEAEQFYKRVFLSKTVTDSWV